MSDNAKYQVKDLIQKINRLLIGNHFEFEEDRTVLIELAITEWNAMPALKYYEKGMCAKVAEQVMDLYANYIGEQKEKRR